MYTLFTYKHMYTLTQTLMHAPICPQSLMHAHTQVHTYTHRPYLPFIHPSIHPCTLVYMPAYIYLNVCMQIDVYVSLFSSMPS